MKQILKMLIEHNPRHYTKLNLFGEQYKVCSRCLGMWTAGIISFFIFAFVYLSGFTFEFYHVSSIAFGLAFICFFDWISAKTSLRTGDNNISRIITGGFLGVAISMWIWLLPVPWLFRILSLALISLCFSIIVFLVNYHEMKQGLFDCYEEYFHNYKRMYECGCCGASCCALPTYCCYGAIIICCCICPALVCYLLVKK